MRPPELDVTFVLQQLDCFVTEDAGDGDEPYLWHLAFKVDAETLGPPPIGSLVPSLNVKVFEGGPHFRHVVGAGHVKEDQSPSIHPSLGTRSLRLKPAYIPAMGWFAGLAGTLCLLWDEDGFAPSTAEVGFSKFKALFGPALTHELNRMAAGDYDDELAKNAAGIVQPDGPEGRTLRWRFSRLADADGRRHAVAAMTKSVKDAVIGRVTSAILDEAGLDELIDRDDLLGVAAQVYTGNELSGTKNFSLAFTDDEANYSVRGLVSAVPVHRAVLDAVVTRLERHEDRAIGVWRQVCWGPTMLYWAIAYLVKTTVRYELRSVLGENPVAVRWFIDDNALPEGESNLSILFEPTDKHFSPPQDVLAPFFTGGPSPIKCRVTGSVLEVSNEGANGVFYGKVRALYAYAGDPSLFPTPEVPLNELFARGYDRSSDLDIVAVDLDMNDDYARDVATCARKISEIDLKHIAPNFGKEKPVPGDPPNWRHLLAERLEISARIADIAGVDIAAAPNPNAVLSRRRLLSPR